MNKVEEIFKAWNISFNPNDEQYDLAVKRLTICEGCEFKSDAVIKHCTVCGCALKAKIYSPVMNSCPKGKWEKVDKEHELNNRNNRYDELKK